MQHQSQMIIAQNTFVQEPVLATTKPHRVRKGCGSAFSRVYNAIVVVAIFPYRSPVIEGTTKNIAPGKEAQAGQGYEPDRMAHQLEQSIHCDGPDE